MAIYHKQTKTISVSPIEYANFLNRISGNLSSERKAELSRVKEKMKKSKQIKIDKRGIQ
jgi:hypothetical protein